MDDEDPRIASALRDVENGKYKSIRAAARAYNIKHTTLYRRRNGQKSHKISASEMQILTPQQEEMLARELMKSEKDGHVFTYDQTRQLATMIYQASGGKDYIIGKNWILRFLGRHPDVRTKHGKSAVARPVSSAETVSDGISGHSTATDSEVLPS